MKPERLRELGYDFVPVLRPASPTVGAWFATAPDGAPVILRWLADETAVNRYAMPQTGP